MNNFAILCPECHGETVRRAPSDVAQVHKGTLLFLKNVPSLRCDQCGHSQITARTAKRLEKLIKEGKFTGVTPAFTYDLAQVTRQRIAPATVAKTDLVQVAFASPFVHRANTRRAVFVSALESDASEQG